MPRKASPAKGRSVGSILDRDALIDSAELADYLRVPIGTLDQWASKGGGPLYHKVGIHRRYHPADVKAWLADRRLAASGHPSPAA